MTPKRIGLLGCDGVSALHLVTPAEIFHAARLNNGFGGRIACYDVWIVTVALAQFETECGLTLLAQANLETAPRFDTIIVSSGSGMGEAGVVDRIAGWLLQRASETSNIASIGSGIYGVAATGLLAGRAVTTSRQSAPELSRTYPEIRIDLTRSLIQDDKFYSSNGIDFGLSLALAIIEADYGAVVASLTRDKFLSRPSAHQRASWEAVCAG